ncbi:subtilisin family serine protease [Actinoplanes tereljensis]|uniref:S8 family serine peptidase n=1 Tax=Paractinoplanes tereljensis TaxID=571912 RepID=UPI001EF2843E|nr:S8 family serine peptidase [Actinoplanes tereljensis]
MTLLTGDVVTVRTTGSGCAAVTVRPVAKSGIMHRSCTPDGHVHVVPGRVAPLVGKQLDPALFDVTALIADGYDDARTRDLPLIVRPGGSVARLAGDPLTAGLSGARTLPSIAAVAGRRAKSAGPALLASLAGRAEIARSNNQTPKIWLDRRVRATATPIDPNLRQIAAPQAWSAGYTGRGTTVAVLDTGVDATHPDLAGQIAETMDFTVDGGDAVDHFGHGTHVAATIAGTGAASHGARRGVAPGARLAIGKVLDDYGYGTDAQVIAGMEWAASRADVVNMSLGGFEPSDGTDPLSLAVDALSEQTGALFVVAAGNDGPADGTVSAPGAAADALTVGAVDSHDAVAEFSSRGPLINTHAGKPEIAAPGVDIVAARAAGTMMGTPIDANYVASSGTSMATPHVAGAAAVLAQRHPDWTGAKIKAALVGAADPVPAFDAYAVGAGRLDVARPLSGVVAAPDLSWTNTGSSVKETKVGVTTTDHNGGAAPAGAVTLSAGTLRLAPGATGSLTLNIDKARLAPGLWTALVSTETTRTPVTFYVEPPSYDLTIATSPIPGTPEGALGWVSVQVVNIDDPAVFATGVYGDPGDTLTVRVPAGRYSVMAAFDAFTDDFSDERAAMAGDPDVVIGADTTVKFDLSKANRLGASVDGVATGTSSLGLTYLQTGRRGPTWSDFAFLWGEPAKTGNVYVLPSDGAGVGDFRVYSAFGLDAPGRHYDLIRAGNALPADPVYRVTPAEQARLARIDQHFYRLDMPDPVTGHKRYGLSPDGEFLAENTTYEVSGDRTDYVTPGYGWVDEAFWNETVTQEGIAHYAPGSRQSKTWVRQPLRSDWYDDPNGSKSGCEPAAPGRTSGNIHVELVTLTDQHQRFDCLSGGWGLDLDRTLTLTRDGRVLGTATDSIADFAVPKDTGNYRLTYDVDASRAIPLSTRISTSWTFRSTGPSGTGHAPLPLLAVDYQLPLDAANQPLPSGAATFVVRQAQGVRPQAVTAFTVDTSLDGGATWQPAAVSRAGADTFRADVPKDGTVSLRVTATGATGSGISQTIINAY